MFVLEFTLVVNNCDCGAINCKLGVNYCSVEAIIYKLGVFTCKAAVIYCKAGAFTFGGEATSTTLLLLTAMELL